MRIRPCIAAVRRGVAHSGLRGIRVRLRVGPGGYWGGHVIIQRTLNPRLLSRMAPYDVASNGYCSPRRPTCFEPSSLESNDAL